PTHYRPIREEDDSGLEVGRKVYHGLGANWCLVVWSEPPAAARYTSFSSRRAVSSSDKSEVLGSSSQTPRFEPRSGALASTACVFRIGGVDIGICPRSTHARAVDSPVSTAGVAVLVLPARSSVLPPSRSGSQPASSSHLRRASRLPALSANAKSTNPSARERGELKGHIVHVVLASWPWCLCCAARSRARAPRHFLVTQTSSWNPFATATHNEYLLNFVLAA
ncbi:hypothetical protein B0H13DRAFT_2080238, partial [Mycena leptocephala]